MASSQLEGVPGRVRQPQGTFQEGSPNSPLIMTNSELQNLLECRKLFPPKFSAAPTAQSCGRPGKKGGGGGVVRRAAELVLGRWAIVTCEEF